MLARSMLRSGRKVMAGAALFFALLPPAAGAAAERVRLAYLDRELPELKLHELMDLEVTSAAGGEQKVSETAAAVFVITQEDIRRSGATSIPEVLRMVPGLTVARIDASKWAISSRSFNSLFANKLLVLMDGRSVFSTLFPSTFWDVQDTLLEDIDRIEVIRGPAATIWGANAVNGVINIITKEARLTQGALATLGGGSEERAFGGLRYGGRLGPETYWRSYAKYFRRDEAEGIGEREAADQWEALRGGFRLDRLPARGGRLTVQGDAYTGSAGLTGIRFDGASAVPREIADETGIAGASLRSRWEHPLGEQGKRSLQFYYDWARRRDFVFDEDRHSLDFSFQRHLKAGRRHEVVWGAGYRYTLSEVDGSPTFSLLPGRGTEHLYSLFGQDRIALVADRLLLTVGARIERNGTTGYEIQPNLRLLAILSGHHSLWGAASRAARTPSRFDRESRVLSPSVSAGTPGVFVLSGSGDFDAERVTAFETGYRYHPEAPVSFDAALFYNLYTRLRSFEPGVPFPEASPPPLHLVQPVTLDNNLEGETWGLELAGEWQPARPLRLSAAYTYLQIAIRHRDRGGDSFARVEEEKSPVHQGSLRAGFDPAAGLALDLWLRYVDRLRRDHIPGYLELDTRLGWKPRPTLEVALVGQNLLDRHHPEFPRESLFNVLPTEVQRGVYLQTTWRH